MNAETKVSSALLDLKRAVGLQGLEHALHTIVPWALIGGQALIAYGVPRETLDADALIDEERLDGVAHELVDTFGWTPRKWDDDANGFIDTDELNIHIMEDPVLYDIGKQRVMIALRTPLGLPVELLAAQHPIEMDMIDGATKIEHQGVTGIPVAPLGGILLVKTKADRSKDIAAIEQTAEHLPQATLNEALAWAKRRDPTTTEDLASMVMAVRMRMKPVATRKARKRTP